MLEKHFPALKHRNYQIYLSGQFISLIGTWMQRLAMSWIIYRLTKSALWLGIAGFASQIPMFVFGLFAGVIVDHVDRHKLLVWTQALAARARSRSRLAGAGTRSGRASRCARCASACLDSVAAHSSDIRLPAITGAQRRSRPFWYARPKHSSRAIQQRMSAREASSAFKMGGPR